MKKMNRGKILATALAFALCTGSLSFASEEVQPDLTGEEYAYADPAGIRIPGWNTYDESGAPIGNTPEDMVIAVIDSGVNYEHRDLRDVMWRKGLDYPELTALGGGEMGINLSPGRPDGTVYDVSDPMDDRYHGTHVAGIIAGEWDHEGISGGVSGAKIMAVKALSGDGSGTTAMVVEGLKYVLAAKRAGVPVAAVNISWGGSSDQGELLNALVTELGMEGVVCVFAACNNSTMIDGNWTAANFLGANPYALIVSATDAHENLGDFSDYGPITANVAAPGDMILSTYMEAVEYDTGIPYEPEPEETEAEKTERDLLNEALAPDYAYLNGTSMATPVATAAVAILKAAFPEEGADCITARLIGSCRPVEALAGKVTSGGIIDVSRALAGEVNPVPQRISSEENIITVDGYFFGETAGTLSVNGEACGILSWTDREITAKLPETWSAGPVYVTVTSSEGRSLGRTMDIIDENMLPLPDAPDAFIGLEAKSMCVLDNCLYLAGNTVNDSMTPALWRFSLDSMEWENLSDRLSFLPEYTQIYAVTPMEDALLILTDQEIYRMSSDSPAPEPLLTDLDLHGEVQAQYFDEKLWVKSGSFGETVLMCADPEKKEISHPSELPAEVRGILMPSGILCPNDYTTVMLGSRDSDGYWMYRLHSTTKGSMPMEKSWIAMGCVITLVSAFDDSFIYCFGTSTTLPGNYFLRRIPIE